MSRPVIVHPAARLGPNAVVIIPHIFEDKNAEPAIANHESGRAAVADNKIAVARIVGHAEPE
jgi:hypothetical protein